MDYSLQLEKQYLDEEIKRSFQNVNYSQWERRKSGDIKAAIAIKENNNNNRLVKSATTAKADKKCSKLCNHGEYTVASRPKFRKSKKQLLKEEENIKILEVKIQNAKDSLEGLKLREKDLIETNMILQEYVESTEMNAHENVDEILRKYEKYRNVLTTMTKKHSKEVEESLKDLKRVEKEIAVELPVHENRVKKIDEELNAVQELYKILSTYKNQEYPEKLLQIKNLQKQVIDMQNVHAEETEELVDMIHKETNRLSKIQIDAEKTAVKEIFDKSNSEMHESLKDMAEYNQIMRDERVFHLNTIETLKKEIKQLEDEIVVLLKDERRHTRRTVYPEFYKKQPQNICTPDMEVTLNI